MDWKIEKNVPITARGYNGGKVKNMGYGACLAQMEKGDSVVFPLKIANATTVATRIFGKGHFVCRTHPKGTRIWRIK